MEMRLAHGQLEPDWLEPFMWSSSHLKLSLVIFIIKVAHTCAVIKSTKVNKKKRWRGLHWCQRSAEFNDIHGAATKVTGIPQEPPNLPSPILLYTMLCICCSLQFLQESVSRSMRISWYCKATTFTNFINTKCTTDLCGATDLILRVDGSMTFLGKYCFTKWFCLLQLVFSIQMHCFHTKSTKTLHHYIIQLWIAEWSELK